MLKKSLFLLSLSFFAVSLLSAGEKYQLDAAHSSIDFAVKHMVISKTKGKFKDVKGEFMVDEKDITSATINVTIQTASIETANEKRDGHLKSADFFDVEQFPTIGFISSKIKKTGDSYAVTGNLTIKGVTKEVTFPFELNGFTNDPYGNRRLGVSAQLKINRHDYNLKWSKSLDGGGLVVGDMVEIALEVEGVRSSETN